MKRLIIRIIEWYQTTTRHTRPTCRYHPTCSQYAKTAFQKRNFFYAAILTTYRIIRCNPLSKGGYDPVPEKKNRTRKDEDHEKS